MRQVYNKLGVNNRGEAVIRARNLDLLPSKEQGGRIRNNLPLAATPFVGRARELGSLSDLFADPQIRIITISGPGGIGKTRLALEAAGRELEPGCQFSDGVFFVSLAPLESAGEIVSTLASVLDFHFQDSGNEQEQLLNYLRNKQMLLVMDNFEHILDGRALLAEINEQAAGITLLVTSRERLQMRGEQLFPLGGLETAQVSDSIEDSPAAVLFLNIARRTVPDFEILAGDVEPLLRICRIVEGMPLGLELAASWTGSLPLSEIAAEMEQSLTLLVAEHHDVPQRHRSMEAALDVSWRRLAPEQQRTFKGVTVFRGGFTRTAAAEVAGATLPLLVTLANKSWLTYDRQEDRYHIHELLRQYGAARLSAEPTHEQDVQARHSTYFCGYLQEREEHWFGPRQKEAAAEIGDEIDNIQRAWRWAANKEDGVLLSQGLNSLCRFFVWERRMMDGQNACSLAADVLSKSLEQQQGDDGERLALWSRVLAWKSDFVREVAQREALLDQSQQLLDRAKEIGYNTKPEQAFILLAQADALVNRNLDKATRSANLGLLLFQELGDRWGESETLWMLSVCYLLKGAHNEANRLLHDCLNIRQQLNDHQGIAKATTLLGLVARYQGRFEEAEKFHRHGITLSQQLGNRRMEMLCLGHLSYTLSWAGKFLAAREATGEAIRIEQDLGQLLNPWRLNNLAMATIHLGHYKEGSIIANDSLENARHVGVTDETGKALTFLGEIAFAEDDFEGAKRNLLESVAVLADFQHVHLALPLAILSYVIRAQGDEQMGREHLIRAIRIGTKFHSISPMIYCLPAAALFAADDGHAERAIEFHSLARQFGHIANSRWFEDVACSELEEVRASLQAEEAAAAEARGREMDVWETAEALLRELDGYEH